MAEVHSFLSTNSEFTFDDNGITETENFLILQSEKSNEFEVDSIIDKETDATLKENFKQTSKLESVIKSEQSKSRSAVKRCKRKKGKVIVATKKHQSGNKSISLRENDQAGGCFAKHTKNDKTHKYTSKTNEILGRFDCIKYTDTGQPSDGCNRNSLESRAIIDNGYTETGQSTGCLEQDADSNFMDTGQTTGDFEPVEYCRDTGQTFEKFEPNDYNLTDTGQTTKFFELDTDNNCSVESDANSKYTDTGQTTGSLQPDADKKCNFKVDVDKTSSLEADTDKRCFLKRDVDYFCSTEPEADNSYTFQPKGDNYTDTGQVDVNEFVELDIDNNGSNGSDANSNRNLVEDVYDFCSLESDDENNYGLGPDANDRCSLQQDVNNYEDTGQIIGFVGLDTASSSSLESHASNCTDTGDVEPNSDNCCLGSTAHKKYSLDPGDIIDTDIGQAVGLLVSHAHNTCSFEPHDNSCMHPGKTIAIPKNEPLEINGKGEFIAKGKEILSSTTRKVDYRHQSNLKDPSRPILQACNENEQERDLEEDENDNHSCAEFRYDHHADDSKSNQKSTFLKQNLQIRNRRQIHGWIGLVYLYIGILFLIGSSGTEGALSTVPVNTIVTKGQTARMTCSTTAKDAVYWSRAQVGSTTQRWVYYGEHGINVVVADDRFSIDSDKTTGRYNLVISDVQPMDAGQYDCVDESGIGSRASAELIVIDSTKCNTSSAMNGGVMANNVFGIKADSIQLTCNLTYRGNIPVALSWTWPGSENHDESPFVTETSNSITSTLKLSPRKELNNATFQCKASVLAVIHHDNAEKLVWESIPIFVKYAEFEAKSVIECPGVNWNLICNPACSYTFVQTENSDCKCQYTYRCGLAEQVYKASSENIACVKEATHTSGMMIAAAITVSILVPVSVVFGIALVYVLRKKKLTSSHPERSYFEMESCRRMAESL